MAWRKGIVLELASGTRMPQTVRDRSRFCQRRVVRTNGKRRVLLTIGRSHAKRFGLTGVGIRFPGELLYEICFKPGQVLAIRTLQDELIEQII